MTLSILRLGAFITSAFTSSRVACIKSRKASFARGKET